MRYPALQQVHIGTGLNGYVSLESYHANSSIYEQEHKALQSRLLQLCPSHLWFKGSHDKSCPRPVLVTKQHQEQLAQLQDALAAAIVDIVDRWWTDSEARFSERMPLEKEEEVLLRWLETHCPVPYRDVLGSWRPDFLVEDAAGDEHSPPQENFRLTEINARFCFNGFLHMAYGQKALRELGVGRGGTTHATDPEEILEGLLSLFQPNHPLHLLKGEEPGIDIHMLVDFLAHNTDIKPRMITPAELRLLPDPLNSGGYKLCCVVSDTSASDNDSTRLHHDGEVLEEIHQVGIELHQRELLALDPELQRQIILRGFNDIRTMLLVHDKRMLGIIKQELESLVSRNILTPTQALALNKGIADTVLPGSPQLSDLLTRCSQSPELRKEYLLKAIRSGKGDGIVFGDEISSAEWVAELERLRDARLVPGRTSYVIQRRICPRLYDVVLGQDGERGRFPLIGTYHAVQGRFLGLGIWRSSPDRICAVSHGGAWMCSIVRE